MWLKTLVKGKLTVVELDSDWEGKGPCAIVPLTWEMAHQSLCSRVATDSVKEGKQGK